MIYGQPKNINLEFSRNWHQAFGQKFIESIIEQLVLPATKKLRYFQLKVVQSWANDKPDLMLKYSQNLQYKLLIPFLQATSQDEELANEDVV